VTDPNGSGRADPADPAAVTDPAGGDPGQALAVGDQVELEIGPVAHGGICVARSGGPGGRVVFVRHALPGDRALVRITEARRGSYCRGDAVTILRADPRRVGPPCAHFRPGGCGGCDFQHASADLQREMKAAVVAEQLRRLAGIEWPVTLEPLPGDGFGWRTRIRWAVGDDGHLGPRRYRSHAVVPVSAEAPCLIAAPGLTEAAERQRPPRTADEVVLTRTADGPPAVAWLRAGRVVRTGPAAAAGDLVEHAAGRAFAVGPTGFWQAHAHAADTLCGAVAGALRGLDLAGGTAWDLYGGVGLFATVLAELVGPGGSVTSVEQDREASTLAALNLRDLPQALAVRARVDSALAGRPAPFGLAGAVDAVVLDPPRSGAGPAVCRTIAERSPAVIVYVACDPAALARDAAALAAVGYQLDALRAFDAFPQTHHTECVARFVPA
jgi:tRNA/tmRNA/rRNA uracil-C5-methylase (TrmA/RlmC/RlmD family)